MTTSRDQQLQSMEDELEKREAGVVDMMELYRRVEEVYFQASGMAPEVEVMYTTDSTNKVGTDAYLGRNPS